VVHSAPVRVGVLAVVLSLLVGCKRDERPVSPPAPSSAVPASALAVGTAAADAREDEIGALVRRWNDALAQRNAAALEDVYGARVSLYGTSLDRASAIKTKAAALAGEYTQSIGPVEVERKDAAHPRATFDKTWQKRGKKGTVRASLGFANEDGRWVVVEESDAKTDQAIADAKSEESCLGLVHRVVLSTEDGKAYRKSPYGTMYVCGPPDCDGFQIAAVRFGNDAMQRLATFDVDQKSGVVSHAGLALAADPKLVARMKAACAKEEP
jgi:hypothetical protein